MTFSVSLRRTNREKGWKKECGVKEKNQLEKDVKKDGQN